MLHQSLHTLLACGYVPYSSMESIIERNKNSYYIALRRTQQVIFKEEQNWEPWLVFFLKTLAKQNDNLAAKVKEEQSLRASLPALSRQVLELVKTRSEITVKEIEESTGNNIFGSATHLEEAVIARPTIVATNALFRQRMRAGHCEIAEREPASDRRTPLHLLDGCGGSL